MKHKNPSLLVVRSGRSKLWQPPLWPLKCRRVRPLRLWFLVALLFTARTVAAEPDQWRAEWPDTDFGRSSVEFSEIILGGPPKDGILALSDPTFIPATQETRLADREPVLTYAPEGVPARAYPIRYLIWHEIVNDEVAGQAIADTFCPLCNSGMIFDARVGGVPYEFGVSGLLRHSDMIMYDRETGSWWQQAIGEAIVGELTGTQLTQLPAVMESWSEFRMRHPDGLVMDEPDWQRAYGQNPYVSYDSSIQPFLYGGERPPHGIPPLARVVRVGERAWPLERLREAGNLKEAGVTLSWTPGQASALDTVEIGGGQEVGTVRVTDADGHALPYEIPFAFAFHAFFPQGEWMLGR